MEDQFQTVTITLAKPGLFCNPVDKNGEGIIDSSTHLTCYDKPLLTRWDPTPEQLTATDQFGERALDVRSQSSAYCVPTTDLTNSQQQANAASSPALKALSATGIDKYNLYWAKTTPRTPKFERREVSLVDQWIDEDAEMIRPIRFLTPTKNYIDQEAKLTCYKIRMTGKFEKRDVNIQNQFGQETLSVKKPSMLCLPSEQPAAPQPG